jgi:hypothetical protein
MMVNERIWNNVESLSGLDVFLRGYKRRPQETPVGIVYVLAEIWTEHLPNRSQKRYPFSQLTRFAQRWSERVMW